MEDCGIYQAFKNNSSCHSDSDVFWHPNGKRFPVEWWSVPLMANGEVTGAVVTFIDLSEKIAKQKEIETVRQEIDGIFHVSLDILGIVGFENRCRTKSGDYRTISWVAAPVVEASQIFFTARDITEQKAKDLIFHQSSRMSTLGEMAAGIAHEINNPLAIILGKAQRLLKLAESNRLRPQAAIPDLHKIENTVSRAASIIRGLRSFARDGESDPFERASIAAIVEDALAFSRLRFADNGVLLEVIDRSGGATPECRSASRKRASPQESLEQPACVICHLDGDCRFC